MTPERWQRLKPLFEKAVEMSAEKRAQLIAAEFPGDPESREEFEELLRGHDEGTGSLDRPLMNLGGIFPEAKKFSLAAGDLLLGRFRIVRPIDSGGMGEVYEAIDLDLGQGRIALKTIRPTIAENSGALERFKEEIILAWKVGGANVCRIHQLHLAPKGSGEKCRAFLTMEYLEGVTLSERIAKGGPVPSKEAMEIATQLCQALQTIHEARIIHRDLKPRNIMLVPNDGSERVVVMDFGLARAVAKASATDETGLTVPGAIMGTPEYMAPEQFVAGADVTPATDIYSLGIVLYELVTGKQAFAASTPFAAAVRRGRRPDSPSSIRRGLPPVWDDVIARCMEYEPARRYQSANEVIDALHQHTLVVWRFKYGQRIALTRRSLYAIAAVALVLITFGGRSWYLNSRIHPPLPASKHWYDRGMMALRDGTYLQAAKQFRMAVDSDNKYALAHARLAEAWAELDFTGKAREEMLIATAPEQANSMPDLDGRYVDAVRSTLVRDYSAAAQDYEEILKRLPNDQRAEGYVDLGRAYEKAGRVSETIAAYEKAAQMKPDDPAPFVHLGILKSRQRDPVAAEVAFAKAEVLYEAGSNLEGLAEVAYQRGYAANEEAAGDQARKYLDKSLAIARQIPSVQLEVRSLSQLSSVEYNSGHADKGIEYANQVIKLARDNGLEYWSADGLMRLGNAYLDKQDYAKAEQYSQQALRLAQETQHPRIEAAAELTLASVRDRQGKPDEQMAYAKDALGYYRDFGFTNMAAQASTIIIRGEEGKGEFTQALGSATDLLELSTRSGNALYIGSAEETVGGILLDLEQYPAALAHYEASVKASESIHEDGTYPMLASVEVLWRLGRYSDAEATLSLIPASARKRKDFAARIQVIRAQMQLSRGKYQVALNLARQALHSFPDMDPASIADLEEVIATSEMRLGQDALARRDADLLLATARKDADEGIVARAELIEAEITLRSHSPEQATQMAEAASQYFFSKDKKESEWMSLVCLAKAAKVSGNSTKCSESAKRATAILQMLEQEWGTATFREYSSRIDRAQTLQDLVTI